MSTKSTKAGKKLSVPRALPEIQSEYQQMCANLGQVDYQLYIYTKEKEKLRTRIEAINNEAAVRNQLDKENKAEQEAAFQDTASAEAALAASAVAALENTQQQSQAV